MWPTASTRPTGLAVVIGATHALVAATGATGLEPATSGVTGAFRRRVKRGRFLYLKRNERATQLRRNRDKSSYLRRLRLVWAPLPKHRACQQPLKEAGGSLSHRDGKWPLKSRSR